MDEINSLKEYKETDSYKNRMNVQCINSAAWCKAYRLTEELQKVTKFLNLLSKRMNIDNSKSEKDQLIEYYGQEPLVEDLHKIYIVINNVLGKHMSMMEELHHLNMGLLILKDSLNESMVKSAELINAKQLKNQDST